MNWWEILAAAIGAAVGIGVAVAMLFLIFRLMSELRRARYSTFDLFRREYIPYEAYGTPLFDIIRSAERESGVTLTSAARQMLILPVIETIDSGVYVEWSQVNNSIHDVVRTAAEEEGPRDPRFPRGPMRNSINIISAFHRCFCNIPPFCARRE